MNAAFLLVTAAWLTGVDADPPKAAAPVPAPTVTAPAPAAPAMGAPTMAAPIASTPIYSGGGCSGCGAAPIATSSACGCGCGEAAAPEKEGFLARLKGKFKKGGEAAGECDACGAAPAEAPKKHHRKGGEKAAECESCAQAAPCGCETAAAPSGPSMREKMKGIFHHKGKEEASDCGCATPVTTGCSGCGGTITPYATSTPWATGTMSGGTIMPGTISGGTIVPSTPMPKVEPIPSPKTTEPPAKKLPTGTDGKSVQAVPQSGTPVLEVAPAKLESPF